MTEHRDGLNRQARNPVGLPDGSGALASAGGSAGNDIIDHRRQVGTPHDVQQYPWECTCGLNGVVGGSVDPA